MKYLLFFFLFITVSAVTWAQKTVAIFDSQNGFSNIQGLALGDSVLTTYYSGAKNVQNFQSVIVTPEGKQIPLSLPELHKSTLLAAVQTADSIGVYYFDKENTSAVPALLNFHRSNGGRKVRPLNLPINGVVTTFFVDRNLFVVSVNKNERTLTFTEIKGNRVVNQLQYAVGEDAENLSKFQTRVIRYADLVRPSDAASPVKIYPANGLCYVTMDYRENRVPTHIVLTLNPENRTVTRWKMTGKKSEVASLFIAGNTLIRVAKNSRDFRVKRYALQTQQEIDSFMIRKKDPIAKLYGTQRNDRTDHVTNSFKVKKIIKDFGVAFVTAYETDSGLVLKLGTHQISTVYFPMVSGLGLAVQAITAMASISLALNTGDNLDQYFYVTWDGKTYSYIQKPAVAERTIDEFEVAGNSTFKGYIDGATITYGLYKIGEGKLWLLAYKR